MVAAEWVDASSCYDLPHGLFPSFYLTTLSQYTSTDNVANIREGGRGRNRCSTLQKAHGGQYSVERNRWDTHEFRKSPPARGGQQTSARRGGGIRGLLAHVAAAVGALKRLSTRGDLHCSPSSSHPRGVCLPLTIPWYWGARGRWVPFPYLEQAGLGAYRHFFSEEEVVSLFLFLLLFLLLLLLLLLFVLLLLFLILFLLLFLFLYEFMFYSQGCLSIQYIWDEPF